jgi:hypothetical protein
VVYQFVLYVYVYIRCLLSIVRVGRRLAICLSQGFSRLSLFPRGYRKNVQNEYMSFSFTMYKHASFQSLSLFLTCTVQGRSYQIGLGPYRGWYSIINTSGQGKSGRVCLNLHRNLDYVTKSKCRKFHVFVGGVAFGSKLCFRGHQFHRKNEIPCHEVDNEP